MSAGGFIQGVMSAGGFVRRGLCPRLSLYMFIDTCVTICVMPHASAFSSEEKLCLSINLILII